MKIFLPGDNDMRYSMKIILIFLLVSLVILASASFGQISLLDEAKTL